MPRANTSASGWSPWDAQRIGLQGHGLSVGRAHAAVAHHAQHLGDGLVQVGDHGVGLAARRQLAVGLVGPVGEDFLRRAQADGAGSVDQGAAGQPVQHQVAVDIAHRLADRARQRRILGRHVVERAVRLT